MLFKNKEIIQFTDENKNQVFNQINGTCHPDFEDGKPILKVYDINHNTLIIRLNDCIIENSEIGTYYKLTPDEIKEVNNDFSNTTVC